MPRLRCAAATRADEKFVCTGDFLVTSLGAKLLKLWEVRAHIFRRNHHVGSAGPTLERMKTVTLTARLAQLGVEVIVQPKKANV